MNTSAQRRKPIRWRQNIGYFLGATVGLLILAVLILPGMDDLHVFGPLNTGHENLACNSCHDPAAGTLRQQLQANIKYILGMRKTPVDIIHKTVTNEVCLDCHSRPNDRHPAARFLEPRFKDARQAIQPQLCTSCHAEHSGKRVTIESTYCVNCHTDLKVNNDPIEIPHAQLIADKRWQSCLSCHDFHGNHQMTTPTTMHDAVSQDMILSYFNGGLSPYSTDSTDKIYPAKRSR
jgi:hypothetical protein